MTEVAVGDLLDELKSRTADKFSSMPSVVIKDDSFDVDKLPIDKAEWHRLTDVVAVMADMKDSTRLDDRRKPASTASIYDAGVGGVARVYKDLDADFIDIQGDGAFGLFWGAGRYERAICAGITTKSFSDNFTAQLAKKWPEAPSTGFKIGVASGGILAKRVGVPKHLEFQEPVWAGRPVNYAAKAAQQTEPIQLVVAGSVWDKIKNNDYLTLTCDCNEPVPLWSECEIDKIPDDERFGMSMLSSWCKVHGSEYCQAILDGKTIREGINDSQRNYTDRLKALWSDAAIARSLIHSTVAQELKAARLARAGARGHRL